MKKLITSFILFSYLIISSVQAADQIEKEIAQYQSVYSNLQDKHAQWCFQERSLATAIETAPGIVSILTRLENCLPSSLDPESFVKYDDYKELIAEHLEALRKIRDVRRDILHVSLTLNALRYKLENYNKLFIDPSPPLAEELPSFPVKQEEDKESEYAPCDTPSPASSVYPITETNDSSDMSNRSSPLTESLTSPTASSPDRSPARHNTPPPKGFTVTDTRCSPNQQDALKKAKVATPVITLPRFNPNNQKPTQAEL